jgi:hypothetical protein
MSPSTESSAAERKFAAEVLANLLQHIEQQNVDGHDPYLVSHAWTDGPMLRLVYKAPPSDITWGLARDARDSIIDPGPWLPEDDPALYYYLCDLEEGRMSASFRHPGEPGTILWRGYPLDGLPDRPTDIPVEYRYTPPTPPPPSKRPQEAQPDIEPRRYGNPL